MVPNTRCDAKVTIIHGIYRKKNMVYKNLSRLVTAVILWLGSCCPEVTVRGRGIFVGNPDSLKVRAGGFNTQ